MAVSSWDIFDTIIARRCYEAHTLFHVMAERLGVPALATLRQKADHATTVKTYQGIYQELQRMTNMQDKLRDHLATLELQLEREHCFLIPEIYDQIEDGDILVSDMYLDSETLGALLRSVGFAKDVKIYATHSGKASGKIWPELKRAHDIKRHTGDNFHSDVISPHRHQLKSRHFYTSYMNHLEQRVYGAGYPQLARVMRTTRLMNPYIPGGLDYALWNEQATLNGAILYLSSLLLHHHILPRRPQGSQILFASRDSVHWHALYRALFSEDAAYYFESSRTMFYQPTPAYLNYVRRFGDPDKIILADIYGSGKSLQAYVSKHASGFPFYFVITGGNEPWNIPAVMDSPLTYAITRKTTNPSLEILNYDKVGTLVDFTENGPVREPPRHDIAFLAPYHNAIARFISEATRAPRDHVGAEAPLRELIEMLALEVDRGVQIGHLMGHDGDWVDTKRAPLAATVTSVSPAVAEAALEPSAPQQVT